MVEGIQKDHSKSCSTVWVESTPNFDTVKFWRQYAIAVNDAMLIFCTSDARLPDIDHCTFSSKVKDFAIAYSFDVDQLGLPDLIKQHFELSVDVNSTIVPLQHPVYCKEIQLRAMQSPLSILGKISAEVLFIDEAQDLSPCVQSVFDLYAKHFPRVRIIRVYDVNQSIYLFANRTVSVQPKGDMQFTKSFRFGAGIAAIANCFLQLILNVRDATPFCPPEDVDPAFQIRANDRITDRVQIGASNLLNLGRMSEPVLIISRQKPQPGLHAIHLLNDTTPESPTFTYVNMKGKTRTCFEETLSIFRQALLICVNKQSYTGLMKPLCATDNSAKELTRRFGQMEVNKDDKYSNRIKAIQCAIKLFRNNPDLDSDDMLQRIANLLNRGYRSADLKFQVGTTHSFKGGEANVVYLEEGFAKIWDPNGFQLHSGLTEEELYIYFVAVNVELFFRSEVHQRVDAPYAKR